MSAVIKSAGPAAGMAVLGNQEEIVDQAAPIECDF
jgi:hypothetical protein